MNNLYGKGKISDAEAALLSPQLKSGLGKIMGDRLASDKYERREYIRSICIRNLEGKDFKTALWYARAEDKDDLSGNQHAVKVTEKKLVVKHSVVKTANAARLKVAASQAGQAGLFGFDGMGA